MTSGLDWTEPTSGRSLGAHLRIVLEDASRLGREEFLALTDSIAETTRDRPETDATELIRTSRDRGWR